MNLYQIDEQIQDILSQEIMDPETGEIFDVDNYELLAQLELSRETKIENTALFIKNLEAEFNALKPKKPT